MKNLLTILVIVVLITACKKSVDYAPPPAPVQKIIMADCRGYFEIDTTFPARAEVAKPSLTLTATPVSPTKVVLAWNKKGRNTYTLTRDSSQVYSCQCGGYTDTTGLTPGSTHTYRVNNSNTVTVRMPGVPASSSAKVILLDFDGHLVSGTSYNYAGDFYATPSGLTQGGIDSTLEGVRAKLDTFPVIVTTDEAIFNATDPANRQRHIITEYWQWFAAAGGVAFIGSFGTSIGREEPSFTFSQLLGYRIKDIVFATSHELGHTTDLYHAADFCGQQYSVGPYVMGGNYQQLVHEWRSWGLDERCQLVNEYAVIFNKLR